MTDGIERPDPTDKLWEQIQADSEASDLVKNAILAELVPYMPHLIESTGRINKLLATARQLADPPGFPIESPLAREAAQDILRAAVVLTHAYLEDFLRTIARAVLPSGDEHCLSSIPLAGLPGGRAQKFFLGELVRHRGKSVDEVLRQSVSEYYDRSNFNNTTEIADLLRKLGLDVERYDQQFASLDQMIERRHWIVHRADRIRAVDSKGYFFQPISEDEVLRWLTATTVFMSNLLGPLINKLNPLDELVKRLNIKLPTDEAT